MTTSNTQTKMMSLLFGGLNIDREIDGTLQQSLNIFSGFSNHRLDSITSWTNENGLDERKKKTRDKLKE